MRFVHTWFSSGGMGVDTRQGAVVLADDLDPTLRDLVAEDRERALEPLVDIHLLLRSLVEMRVLLDRLDELRDAPGRVLELARDARRGQP